MSNYVKAIKVIQIFALSHNGGEINTYWLALLVVIRFVRNDR